MHRYITLHLGIFPFLYFSTNLIFSPAGMWDVWYFVLHYWSQRLEDAYEADGKVLLSWGKREAASFIVIQIQEICREQKVWATHACSFSTGEVKAGRWEAQGQPGLQSEPEISLGYMRENYFKNKRTNNYRGILAQAPCILFLPSWLRT